MSGFIVKEPQEKGQGGRQHCPHLSGTQGVVDPPPSRAMTCVGSTPTDEFNRPIPTAVALPVTAAQESSLMLFGGDKCFTRAMNFNLPLGLEELIGSVPEEDILDGGVEMICCSLILTRREVEACRRRIEDMSRLKHLLQEASNNLK